MGEPASNIPAHRLLVSLNGKSDFGEITAEQAACLSCKAGPIRLLTGFHGKNDSGFGLTHIEGRDSRVREITTLGYNPLDMIALVAASFEMADLEPNGRICAVMACKSAYVHLYLEWDDSGFWSVTTLIPKRHKRDAKGTWTKKRPDESEPTSESAGS